jgi:DNA-binding transcriptional ArsR family regulator
MKKTNREEPTYYGILPAEIRYAKNISPMEKIMYAEISALASKTGKCWGSNGYFAELYDVQPTTVSEWINNLERAGYVSITGAKSKNRVITLVNILRKKPKTPKELPEAQPSEKVEHNNTSSNTINIESEDLSVEFKALSFFKEIQETSSIPHDRLIAYFVIRKQLYKNCSTKKQALAVIARHTPVAKRLKIFENEKILKVMDTLDDLLARGKLRYWGLEMVEQNLLGTKL